VNVHVTAKVKGLQVELGFGISWRMTEDNWRQAKEQRVNCS